MMIKEKAAHMKQKFDTESSQIPRVFLSISFWVEKTYTILIFDLKNSDRNGFVLLKLLFSYVWDSSHLFPDDKPA